MKNQIQIINIDGTEGSGKTTQINHLLGLIRLKGRPVMVNYMDDTIKSALECAEKTNRFLEENPDGIVVNDGSIARMIVGDLSKGMSQESAIEKYRPIIHEHEKMFHKYKTANLLFILDNLSVCNDRYEKEAKILGYEAHKKIDPDIEKTIIQGLRKFDSNMITNNLKFHTIEIDSEDTILEIKDSVIKHLREHFTLDL